MSIFDNIEIICNDSSPTSGGTRKTMRTRSKSAEYNNSKNSSINSGSQTSVMGTSTPKTSRSRSTSTTSNTGAELNVPASLNSSQNSLKPIYTMSTTTTTTTNNNTPSSRSSSPTNNNQNNNNSNGDLIKILISNLKTKVEQIDQCSPSTRTKVWEEIYQLSIKESFESKPKSELLITSSPLYNVDGCTSKLTPFLKSMISEPTTNYHSIQLLSTAFQEAETKYPTLYKQKSPQTTTDSNTSSDAVNHYLVPSLGSLLLSSNLWGYTLPAALQQLALLHNWTITLDSLPSNQKKLIWETCCLLPSFKQSMGTIKMSSFTKAIKAWSVNPIQYMLPITTIFGSIGFLVFRGVLNNEFNYPTSSTKVFNFEKDQCLESEYEDTLYSLSSTPSSSSHAGGSSRKKSKHRHGSVDGYERVPSMSPPRSSAFGSSPDQYGSYDETSDEENSSPSDLIKKMKNSTTSTDNSSPITASSPHSFTSLQSISNAIDNNLSFNNTNQNNNNQKDNELTILSSLSYNNQNSSKSTFQQPSPIKMTDKMYSYQQQPTDNNNSGHMEVSSLDALAMTAAQLDELEALLNASATTSTISNTQILPSQEMEKEPQQQPLLSKSNEVVMGEVDDDVESEEEEAVVGNNRVCSSSSTIATSSSAVLFSTSQHAHSDPPEVPSSTKHSSSPSTNKRKRRFSCSDVKTSVEGVSEGVMNINNILCS